MEAWLPLHFLHSEWHGHVDYLLLWLLFIRVTPEILALMVPLRPLATSPGRGGKYPPKNLPPRGAEGGPIGRNTSAFWYFFIHSFNI